MPSELGDVLLVGSVPFDTVEDVIKTCGQSLGGHACDLPPCWDPWKAHHAVGSAVCPAPPAPYTRFRSTWHKRHIVLIDDNISS